LYTYKAAKQVYKMAKQTCFNDAQLSRYLEGVCFGASEAMSKRYQMGLGSGEITFSGCHFG
jgi:hypothetical protein